MLFGLDTSHSEGPSIRELMAVAAKQEDSLIWSERRKLLPTEPRDDCSLNASGWLSDFR